MIVLRVYTDIILGGFYIVFQPRNAFFALLIFSWKYCVCLEKLETCAREICALVGLIIILRTGCTCIQLGYRVNRKFIKLLSYKIIFVKDVIVYPLIKDSMHCEIRLINWLVIAGKNARTAQQLDWQKAYMICQEMFRRHMTMNYFWFCSQQKVILQSFLFPVFIGKTSWISPYINRLLLWSDFLITDNSRRCLESKRNKILSRWICPL